MFRVQDGVDHERHRRSVVYHQAKRACKQIGIPPYKYSIQRQVQRRRVRQRQEPTRCLVLVSVREHPGSKHQ